MDLNNLLAIILQTRVVILVNEDIGSDRVANNSCALRTGTGWDPDTILEVLVGSDGEIIGAGGNGGREVLGMVLHLQLVVLEHLV